MGAVYSVVGTGACAVCATPFPTKAGRWKAGRLYCGDPCKQKAFHRRHPEKVKANARAFAASHPDYFRSVVLMKYGITLEQYDAKMDEQGGLCAICRQPETRKHRAGQTYSLAVDHDHNTGAVRGLLCRDCNRGIGVFGDRADLIEAAAHYLRRYE